MLKKFLLLSLVCSSFAFTQVFAESGKIAVVDMAQLINKSSQIQALNKEENTRKTEIINIINKANTEIQNQNNEAKKKEIATKYEKQINAKRDAMAKNRKAKLEAINKNISDTIAQQAKMLGYDLVVVKGVVLYGGDDITDKVLKNLK